MPPPWTTKIQPNKGGSFTARSRKISCLPSILIFWRRIAAENSVIRGVWNGCESSWILFLALQAGRGGIGGTFREVYPSKHNQRECSKKKKILTFHQFPPWPALLLLPHQKFIKGISILPPMAPRGAIDLVGEQGYKQELSSPGEGRAGDAAPDPWGWQGMGQVWQFWDHRPLTPLMLPQVLPERHKLPKVSPSAQINRAEPRSLSKSCSWPLRETSGLRCSSLITHLQTTATSG